MAGIIPPALTARLEAARAYIDIDWEWVERGDPRCSGRDFGFWHVQAGLKGWREKQSPVLGYGQAGPPDPYSPCTAEWTVLAEAIGTVLDIVRGRIHTVLKPRLVALSLPDQRRTDQ